MKNIISKLTKSAKILALIGAGYLAANLNVVKEVTNSFFTEAKAQQSRWDYYYNKPPVCYRGNIFLKCNYFLNIEPVLVTDVFLDGQPKTLLQFDRQLTQQEETLLNSIMVDPETPSAYDGIKTKYRFSDLYENRQLLQTKFLLNFHIEYSCDGSTLFVYFDKSLSGGEKNRVSDEVSKLLSITTE